MAYSGQKTIATAGTALVLGSQAIGGPLAIKALPANTGVMYVGNDGAADVTSANGFPLSAGQTIVFEKVGTLKEIWIDASVNGESVAWLMLEV